MYEQFGKEGSGDEECAGEFIASLYLRIPAQMVTVPCRQMHQYT
jgi:hypothetical protein